MIILDPNNLNKNPIDTTLGTTAVVSDDPVATPTVADSPLGQNPIDPVAPTIGTPVEPVTPVTGATAQSPFAATEEPLAQTSVLGEPTAPEPVADPMAMGTQVPEEMVSTDTPVGTVNTPLSEEPEAVEPTAPVGLGGDTTKLSS